MIQKQRPNHGMALVIVLVLSVFLLVLGISYMRTNSFNRPINERLFERSQADFLGQGIVQLAAMKFKKRPAEFYYAYRAMRANLGNAAMRAYLNNDTTLNGSFEDFAGRRYVYSTQMQLVTNKVYATDGIKITVTVTHLSSSGDPLISRVQEHVIEAIRRPL